jgi:hypothetical protein
MWLRPQRGSVPAARALCGNILYADDWHPAMDVWAWEDWHLHQGFLLVLVLCNAVWGTLGTALHVFSCLKSKRNYRLILDPMEPNVRNSDILWSVTGLTFLWCTEGDTAQCPKVLMDCCDSTNVHRQQSCQWQSEPMLMNPICHLPQPWNDQLAFKEAVSGWDLSVWCQILHHETWHWELVWHLLQAPYDGFTCEGGLVW